MSALTTDGAGGVHGTVQTQVSVKATDVDRGASYVGNETDSQIFNVSAGGAQTQTSNTMLTLIGQGQAPNEVLRYQSHITVNANGDVTAVVDNFSRECH